MSDRRWTIHPDGPDGKVWHFYADGEEKPVDVMPVPDDAAIERMAEAISWMGIRHGAARKIAEAAVAALMGQP